MSDMYAIKGTTLTALGDAVRDKVGVGAEIFNFSLEHGSSRTFNFDSKHSKYKLIFNASINWGDAKYDDGKIYIDDAPSWGNRLFSQEIYSPDTEMVGEAILPGLTAKIGFVVAVSGAVDRSSFAEITLTAIPLDENGNEFKYTPLEMVDKINAIEIPKIESIVLTEHQMYGCVGPIASTYVRLFGDTISTNKMISANCMFQDYTNESIPFDLNFSYKGTTSNENLASLFYNAKNLKTLPKINNCRPGQIEAMFRNCYSLREVPEDYFDDFDWSYIETLTSSYSGSMANMFSSCYSLRKTPLQLFKHANKVAYSSYVYFYNGFQNCYALDELVGLPIPYTATYTSNIFYYTVNYCHRLKRLTFEMNEDSTPKVMPWKNQTLDLSSNTGYLPYASSVQELTKYNSGITADKEVKDDATYAALKNDPDWFTVDIAYSRYNHDSAVETINSLPDCSATGTNTIKFKGAAGSLTDGGAINTLTEAEIAVAAAKGWTVSFT